MGKPQARKNDLCDGHGGTPRLPVTWSANVYVNDEPALFVDCIYPKHRYGKSTCSAGPIVEGSTKCKINGKPAARKDDPIACKKGPAHIAHGSPNVFVG